MRKFYLTLLSVLIFTFLGIAQQIPTPKEHFGFNIGDDYKLATFEATDAYFRKIADLSDRVKYVEIGPSEEGRQMPMMIITSPENHKNLAQFKEISQKLGRAEVSEEEAKKLSKQGKPVVWIDGGLHSTETVASHQLIETYYKLVSGEDEETLRLLDDLVILLVHTNPDGQEIITNWYMMPEDVEKRNMRSPYMYQKYVGHDNNRDFFMNNMKESTNLSLQQYVEWIPQIIYNHHQTSPAGTVVAGPPYRDPFNHVFDPLIMTSLDGVGAAMINRLNVEDKPGYTRLSGSVFSSWWNGGLRTTPYFHNIIGILTETTGSPTPSEIPLVPDRLIPTHATPYPIEPQSWNFKKSIDYSVSMNYAVLDYASRNADALLFNIYKMGKNAIDKGNMDNWTKYPKRSDAVTAAFEADKPADTGNNSWRRTMPTTYFDKIFKDPELRDPRGFILSADQADFPTAVKFLNALIKSGVQVHEASERFTVAGKNYPKGSYIVKTAQAFRPHILDMFEPQDHPNDFMYPGGPPVRPYDAAGWTLAFSMGIEFDRVLDGFEGPFQALPYGEILPMPTQQLPSGSGYIVDGRVNNAFIVVNDLLKAGVEVLRITDGEPGIPAGSFYVGAKGKEILNKGAKDLGISVRAGSKPKATKKVSPSKIALFDYYGGSMPSGWVRWMLEQYNFPFQVVYPQEIDKGNLKAKYDVILFIGPGTPSLGSSMTRNQMEDQDVPEEYQSLIGSLTAEKSIPELKKFIEQGGKVVAVGAATSLAYHLELPVRNALVELNSEGKERPLPGDKYYIPGSILKANIATDHPLNLGMNETANLTFNNSPVFKFEDEAKDISPLAWFDESSPLVSGWAWGEAYLKNGIVAFEANLGKGKLIAYGPEITFRAQSHGTFKMLFNNLYQVK
ncbi:M14 metallopeptidase family protein [Belliella kenyensis]|uniref:M14 metallopeptidase family protein n=1 Tax=Belliella kenyensis TaxID=1472724 RepID=A0ABV8EHZ2_9BACT|nr:M14 metallopeptidase family protein [Belliella kenyensis]MCH7400919.1 M14 family metallopeptidase [Belliella kenyensis]MDN3603918.1 M14 family metallopeptidase [Belliella kenyensis]